MRQSEARGLAARILENEQRLLLFLVLLALAIRICALYIFQAYSIKSDWSFGYEAGQIAKSLALGQGFNAPFLNTQGPTAWLMPGYPWLLSVVFRLFGIFSPASAIVVLGLNIIFSSLTVFPLYRLATNCFGRMVAFLAAVAFVFYPPSIWHAINSIWDTTLITFLAVCLLAMLSRYSGDFSRSDAVKFGLLMGLAALVNAVILIFYPFAVLWLIGRNRAAIVTRPKLSFFFLLSTIVFLFLLPWVFRNYYIFDRPLLRSNFGVELWLGNNEQIYENLVQGSGGSYLSLHPSNNKGEFEKFSKLGEIAYADGKFSKARDYVFGNLDKFFYLSGNKFIQYWIGSLGIVWEWSGNLAITFSVTKLKMACHLLPFPFFLLGLIISIKNRENALLIAYLFFIPLVYYVTQVSERYRYPVEPIMLVFACYGVSSIVDYLKLISRRGELG
jgi:4-amino-4-deoxy-L-arabinose transferase-like glycosyltransferase